MLSKRTVTFHNTFTTMVKARFCVKLNAAVNHFINVHLYFYVTSHGINMEDLDSSGTFESEDNSDEGSEDGTESDDDGEEL